MRYLCLIVEPVATTAGRLQREFPSFGFRPYAVDSCRAALALLQQWRFDAVLLDAEAFGVHAAAAVRRVAGRSRAPIALLSAPRDEATQLAWLESGASDIVALPASTQLIAAKLRRLVEAHQAPDDEPSRLAVGPLAMDARRGSASVDGRPLLLTSHQFELLYTLALRLGEFVDRETIARALRSASAESGRTADVHVYRIRKKLRATGACGLRLDTVYGRGYCLSLDTRHGSDEGADDGIDQPGDEFDETPPARRATLHSAA